MRRIHKEEINARSRPDGFSLRAAVSVPDVPRKFKWLGGRGVELHGAARPGHMDPREASGAPARCQEATATAEVEASTLRSWVGTLRAP